MQKIRVKKEIKDQLDIENFEQDFGNRSNVDPHPRNKDTMKNDVIIRVVKDNFSNELKGKEVISSIGGEQSPKETAEKVHTP